VAARHEVVVEIAFELVGGALFFDPPQQASCEEDVGRDVDVDREVDEARHLAAHLPERLLDENDRGRRIGSHPAQLFREVRRLELVDVETAIDPLLQIGRILRALAIVVEVERGAFAEKLERAPDDARLAGSGDAGDCDDVHDVAQRAHLTPGRARPSTRFLARAAR